MLKIINKDKTRLNQYKNIILSTFCYVVFSIDSMLNNRYLHKKEYAT